MDRTVLIVVSDLMFYARIESVVRALGMTSANTDAPRALSAMSPVPALVVIDLHESSGDPIPVISAAKAAGSRVLAFGRHTDARALRAARDAGADRVVPRSQLVEELPALVAELTASAAP